MDTGVSVLIHSFDMPIFLQNELSGMKIDLTVLDDLVHEYCVYRGIVESPYIPSSGNHANTNQYATYYKYFVLVNIFIFLKFIKWSVIWKTDRVNSRFSDGEMSISNVNVEDGQMLESGSNQTCDSELRYSHEVACSSNLEDCSPSDTHQPENLSRRFRRKSQETTQYHTRKRWRGRYLETPYNITKECPPHSVNFASGETEGEQVCTFGFIKNTSLIVYNFMHSLLFSDIKPFIFRTCGRSQIWDHSRNARISV